MDTVNQKSLLVLIARLVLAGVFVMAALPKIQDPVTFGSSVAAFEIIDVSLCSWVALVLPWLELVLGIGILLPWIRQTSSALIGLLLVLFIGLHSSAWVRGLDISCGCFGTETGASSSDYRWLILRNILLLAAVVPIFRQDQRAARADHHGE
jgi:uncharacterized membrane protein YphA (DoxX/SURF4 family)